jgi:hypothetical protein
MAKIFARIRRPSLRWGLLFGIILGVVEVVYNLATSFVTDANAQLILGYIPAVLFLVLGFYAGMRAAQETGKWTSGLAAGLWVGVIGSVVAFIIPMVNTLINLQSIVESSQLYIKAHPDLSGGMKPSDYTASDVLLSSLLELLLLMVNSVLFTLVGGALGGFVGRRRALALAIPASKEYEEPLFEPPVSPTVVEIEPIAETELPDVETEPIIEAEPAEIRDEATK